MASGITREEVQRLIAEENAQLLDVLPGWEHAEEHLPGAINIPLKRLDPESASTLDSERPVIAYCHDYL